ncbi:MAG: CDP-alcohol phosphatidyltransferase family protein [Planctomycetaceae bacterium]|nr:CDP-alcohol phosphatidyltransferase family protein [Planctomycetaceae bacterium]
MPRTSPHLVIDARPRGPRGPLADEEVHGRPVLVHLLDLAESLERGAGPVVVHARLEEHPRFRALVADRPPGRVEFATGPPSEDAAILRTDRLYDPARLRRAVRQGRDPESAVFWRLDRPQGLAGAEDESRRRQSYQPLGRYWALGPARGLARLLCPTRVRPNALTLASAALVLGASLAVALGQEGAGAHLASATALALALVLDTADGHLARLQGTATEFGRWLDVYLDELGDMALHAAIAWSAFARDGRTAWLVLGMLYAMGKYVFVVGTSSNPAPGAEPRVGGGPAPRTKEATVMAAVRLAGHADVRWHLWIVLAALGRLDAALAAYAVYFPARAAALGIRKAVRHA